MVETYRVRKISTFWALCVIVGLLAAFATVLSFVIGPIAFLAVFAFGAVFCFLDYYGKRESQMKI